MVKLTSQVIDRAAPSGRRFILWDDEIKGFGCRVLPTGSKSYILQYRTQSGTSRLLTLGRFGIVKCKAAREEARDYLAMVSKGHDPVLERRDRRESATLQEFFDRYMESHARSFKRPKSADEDEGNYNRHVKAKLGAKKVTEITPHDITRLHAAMSKIPVAANRTFSLLSKMFSLAERWGYIPPRANPCYGLSEIKCRERQHNRRLSPDELKRLWVAIEELGHNPDHKYAAAALKLLILTGARKGEILSARWAWVDWERGWMSLPDSKTGQKNVYLNKPALDILRELTRVDENPHIIVGRNKKKKHLQDLKHIWPLILKRATITQLRIHDLRHVFATTALDSGTDIKVISEMLGHKSVSTTERYLRSQENRSTAASESVAQQLVQLATVGHLLPDQEM